MSRTRITAVLVTALVLAGCDRHMNVSGLANQAPEVRLEAPTAATAGPAGPVHDLRWSATDRDGRVDHFLVTTNPRALGRVDVGWTATADRMRSLAVRRAAPREALGASDNDEPVIFAVRAVDDHGAMSEPAYRAFFGANVAPVVAITVPQPSALITPVLPSTFRVHWQGVDEDGSRTQAPVSYRYILLDETDPNFTAFIVDPDSVRRLYAPGFPGWVSVPGDSTAATLANLVLNRQYLFVITAFDEQGAYDPVFSLNKNMLRFRVGTGIGPRFTVYSEFFYHQFPSGGFFPDTSNVVHVDVPADVPITFHWFAEPPAGRDVTGYRWALDLSDVFDTRPRNPDGKPLDRWTAWDPATTSATVGPFQGQSEKETHRLYVEAADNVGAVSLAIIEFRIIPAKFRSEVLIVDDTRLVPDLSVPGHPDSVRGPLGRWPTAAELDTFLYARGGVPWRSYPAGTLSPAGLFAGYEFDTLGTRTGLADLTIPYETLARYRHVIWIVDGRSAGFTHSGIDAVQPMTSLRYMTMPGRFNSLAQYVESGGSLWLLGGGGGLASMISWNRYGNDQPTTTFSNAYGELVEGRFMYDLAHWRSEFRVGTSPAQLRHAPFPIGRPGGPNYSMLPQAIGPKSPATDPLPPLRSNPSDFYNPVLGLEFLTQPNAILEDRDHSPNHEHLVSKEDTLFVATGPFLPPPGPDPAHDRIVTPVMTLYDGDENGQFIFSGFNVWSPSRADVAQLVDAVLQGIWHLNKAAPAGGAAAIEPMPVLRPAPRR